MPNNSPTRYHTPRSSPRRVRFNNAHLQTVRRISPAGAMHPTPYPYARRHTVGRTLLPAGVVIPPYVPRSTVRIIMNLIRSYLPRRR